jgi:hypothetical protein
MSRRSVRSLGVLASAALLAATLPVMVSAPARAAEVGAADATNIPENSSTAAVHACLAFADDGGTYGLQCAKTGAVAFSFEDVLDGAAPPTCWLLPAGTDDLTPDIDGVGGGGTATSGSASGTARNATLLSVAKPTTITTPVPGRSTLAARTAQARVLTSDFHVVPAANVTTRTPTDTAGPSATGAASDTVTPTTTPTPSTSTPSATSTSATSTTTSTPSPSPTITVSSGATSSTSGSAPSVTARTSGPAQTYEQVCITTKIDKKTSIPLWQIVLQVTQVHVSIDDPVGVRYPLWEELTAGQRAYAEAWDSHAGQIAASDAVTSPSATPRVRQRISFSLRATDQPPDIEWQGVQMRATVLNLSVDSGEPGREPATCTGPGVRFRHSADVRTGEDVCSFDYHRTSAGFGELAPDNFTVAATATWRIQYRDSGTGAWTTLRDVQLTEKSGLRVTEVQTLVVP